MDYTINRGDCLWNIAKSQYGSNLSNSDIMKAVGVISTTNQIQNPNLIYTGDHLNLPEYNSIFNGKKEEIAEISDTIKDDVNTKAVTVDKEAITSNTNITTKNSSNENKSASKEESDNSVIFAECPKSSSKEQFLSSWTKGTKDYANEQIASMDKNNDGTISKEEYLSCKIQNYNSKYSDCTLIADLDGNVLTSFDGETYSMNSEITDFMNNDFLAIDVNGNGQIETRELASYFAALDAMDSDNGIVDGKIEQSVLANQDTIIQDKLFKRRFQNAYNKYFVN